MNIEARRIEASLPAGFSAATCVGVRGETPTIKTFVLKPQDPRLLAFEAGQAISLSIEIGGEHLVRTFSVASAPGAETIELTIKAHAQGRVTRWLHEHLVAGASLAARAPRGRFTLQAATSPAIAFVSAGSGATPLMSMLRALDRSGEALDVAWHHCAVSPDEVLFARDLAEMQARHPKLSVSVALSRAAPGWFGYRGRISRRQLGTAIPDLGRRDVFACGPAAFMAEARLIHAAEGGTPERFHFESFGGDPLVGIAPVVAVPEALAGPKHALTVGGRQIEIGAGETILQGALRQGIVIPCGCGQGLCGTCIVKGVCGDFRMSHKGGLSPDEEAEGYLLACSTRLAGPAEIAL